MELLSSQQEIICLIKDFPPSCFLDQSEVKHQRETEMIRAPWALQGRATVGSLPPFRSKGRSL